LMELIEKKVEAGGKELPVEKPHHRAATNVIDLVEVLQKSLAEASKAGGKTAAKPRAGKSTHEKHTARKRAHHAHAHHKKAA
jgi:non-homologous end joining protein Ku